jgi:putative oxidoreductase
MTKFGSGKFGDELILAARILLMLLFIIFGWKKLSDYSGTVAYMVQSGTPFPPVAAIVAIIMELLVSLAIVFGVLTRPLALLLALYTLATAFIGHHYWTMTGAVQYDNMVNFYKNISIIAGLILLYVTGAGRYSVDARFDS